MVDRMTAADFRAQQTAPSRKYGNETVTVKGIQFDSAREARRWIVLCDMQNKGQIRDLERQVTIHLQGRDGPLLTATGRAMRYIADFVYVCQDTGLTVYEDAKGFATAEYKVKAAVVRAMGVDLVEV